MVIKFFNIRSGLTAVADSEPKLAALWSSSDHSPNITQGQDLGWRLAPEVVIEMKNIKQDIDKLERIASRYKKQLEDLTEVDILHWVGDKTKMETAPVANIDQYADDYDQQVKIAAAAARAGGFDDGHAEDPTYVPPMVTTTTTTTMSIEQLEAELAARKAALEPTTTMTTTIKKK